MMMYAGVSVDEASKRSEEVQFLGITVSNDGKNAISVLWEPRARNSFCTYSVRNLNTHTISRAYACEPEK